MQPPYPPVPTPKPTDGRQAGAPRRGDAVEAWLKRTREKYERGSDEWIALDDALDDYRLHADCGVNLRYEVPTGEGWDY